MPTTHDIRSFAWLLRQDVESTQMKKFLHTYNARPEIRPAEGYAQIECYKDGFDILLSDSESLALPGEASGMSNWRVHSIRFLSPRYCSGKYITPYIGEIVDNLRFPLTREDVRSKLGKPARLSTKINYYDEFDYTDCSMRFTYPTQRNDVVFVSLEAPPIARPKYGVEDSISPQARLKELSRQRKRNWKARLEAYESVFGTAQKVFPGDNSEIDVLVFRDNADCLTLVTSGMSDERMFVLQDSEDPSRLELATYVKAAQKEIVERLTRAAAFPMVEKTNFGHGDTINWMEPLVPGSPLTDDLLIHSIVKEHREFALEIDGDAVELLWWVPISEAELDYKKENGIDALLEIFDQVEHPLVLAPYRLSYV